MALPVGADYTARSRPVSIRTGSAGSQGEAGRVTWAHSHEDIPRLGPGCGLFPVRSGVARGSGWALSRAHTVEAGASDSGTRRSPVALAGVPTGDGSPAPPDRLP